MEGASGALCQYLRRRVGAIVTIVTIVTIATIVTCDRLTLIFPRCGQAVRAGEVIAATLGSGL